MFPRLRSVFIVVVAACGNHVDHGDARLCDALAASSETVKAMYDGVGAAYAAASRAIKMWQEAQVSPPAHDDGKYSGARERAFAYKAIGQSVCMSANLLVEQMSFMTFAFTAKMQGDTFDEANCTLKADPTDPAEDAASAVQIEWSKDRNRALDSQKKFLEECSARFGTKPAQRTSLWLPLFD